MPIIVDPIDEVTNRELFFVKDLAKGRKGSFTDQFDVYDAKTKELLVECREPDMSSWTKVARWLGKKPVSNIGLDTMPPFNYVASSPRGGPQLLRVVRGSSTFSVGGASLEFLDGEDQLICRTQMILLCVGRKYAFNDAQGRLLLMLQAKSGLTKTSLLSNGKEIGVLTTNWHGEYCGYFKERFKYAIWLSPELPKTDLLRNIVFGLGLSYYRVMG